MFSSPELISPAGSWASLQSAIKAGADAVYFGIKELNMRDSADNFDVLEIKKIMQLLHSNQKKGYLTLNCLIYNNEIEKLEKILAHAKAAKVDAIIAWDMAVIELAKKFNIPIHLSTQASVSNFLSLKFFVNLGIKRIVLARECSLADIKNMVAKIKAFKLDCQIETFIHGAMCVSISGRCLLSEHAFDKSANRGECLQPCRREYLIKDSELGDEYNLGKNYILSTKDLCTINFIDKLIKAGVSAFKIEGRMRSPEYVSTVTFTYRQAIDAFFKGKLNAALKKSLRNKLKTVFNRDFDEGFYLSPPKETGIPNGTSDYEKIFIGEVKNFYKRINVAEVLLYSGKISLGDKILIFGKKTPALFIKISELQIEHKNVENAQKGDLVGIKVKSPLKPKDKVFLWRKK
ncbi:MAG: U32 family peptidase [Candidatus Omnitrophota bacterium]